MSRIIKAQANQIDALNTLLQGLKRQLRAANILDANGNAATYIAVGVDATGPYILGKNLATGQQTTAR